MAEINTSLCYCRALLTNTLVFYVSEFIVAVKKSFMIHAPHQFSND